MNLSTATSKVSAVVIMSSNGRFFAGFNKKNVPQTAWSLAGARLFCADDVDASLRVVQRKSPSRAWTVRVVSLGAEAASIAIAAHFDEQRKQSAEASDVCKRHQRDRVMLLWQEAMAADDVETAALCRRAVDGDNAAMGVAMQVIINAQEAAALLCHCGHPIGNHVTTQNRMDACNADTRRRNADGTEQSGTRRCACLCFRPTTEAGAIESASLLNGGAA